MSDDWSEPSLYGRGLVTIEPRLFTEADPVPSVAMPAWQQVVDEDVAGSHTGAPDLEPQWSTPTYVGPRRRQPARTAGRPRRARRAPAVPDAPPREAAQTQVARDAAITPGAPPAEPAAADSNRRLLASSRTMAIASLTGRITGFVRNVLIVAALGTGLVGDAYNGANSFPNMVYELLLGGVMTSIMVPLLVQAQEKDRDHGVAYSQRLLSIATAVLGAATVLAVLCSPLIAAAFVSNTSQRGLTAAFAALLLPQIFFYALAGMFIAVLNVRNVYGPGAWAPVVNNVIVIVTVVVFFALPGPKTLLPSTMTTAQIVVLGVGTTLGIVAQAAVLIPFLRRAGFRWKWRFRAYSNEVGRIREDGALTMWVLGYVFASQVGVVVITKVAYNIPHGGVTYFTNTDLLFSVPQGVLIASLLTALMPRMSRSAARGDQTAVIGDLSLGARLSAVLLIPLTAGFMALGPVFTTALFAYGRTSIESARLIGVSLACCAFGLLPFALVMLQLRVFYAMRDARTPTWINVAMVATKIALVLIARAILTNPQHLVIALNFSTSAAFVVGAVLGHVMLTRRFGPLGFRTVAVTVGRLAVPSAAGGIVAAIAVALIRDAMGTGRSGAAVSFVVGGLLGIAVFVGIAAIMRIPELRELARGLRRQRS
jgi:putative peptidoglycan lipid II flippase